VQLGEAQSRCSKEKYSPTALFVFGDSYVDTGNIKLNEPGSWKDPYGLTFPGKPSGRFSNGRVLTDYIGTSPSLSLHAHNSLCMLSRLFYYLLSSLSLKHLWFPIQMIF